MYEVAQSVRRNSPVELGRFFGAVGIVSTGVAVKQRSHSAEASPSFASPQHSWAKEIQLGRLAQQFHRLNAARVPDPVAARKCLTLGRVMSRYLGGQVCDVSIAPSQIGPAAAEISTHQRRRILRHHRLLSV